MIRSLGEPREVPANASRDQGGRFRRGHSGNPAGKPKGTRHRATLAVEAILDGEAKALTRKAIELAKAGDTMALRLCLERLAPPRKDRPIQVALPALQGPADAIAAVAAVLQAVAAGELTPSEGEAVAKLLEMHRRAVELVDLEDRITRLEQQNGMRL
jgi:hypothetical protein